MLELHKQIENGRCDCQWGLTTDREYAVLILSFQLPVEQKMILFFDIVKQGICVEQILYSRCMYLMVGVEGMKFSEHMGDARILLEVDCEGFEEEWQKTYKKKYVRHICKEYNLSKKEAVQLFEDIHNDMQKIKTLRVKSK